MVEQSNNLSTKGAKQTLDEDKDDDSFFDQPIYGSTITIDNFWNGSFVPTADDLGGKKGSIDF